MAPALVVHSGRVYQFKSPNNWKESWLCLEENGHLVWKRKDAYQVKGYVDLNQKGNIEKIHLTTPKDKHMMDDGKKPFLFQIPIKCSDTDKCSKKTFAVFNREDLELWLDAFATSVGQWKLFKAVREHHRTRVAYNKEVTEDVLEESLTFNEFQPYLRTIWDEYVLQRHNPMAMEEIPAEITIPKPRMSAANIFMTTSPSNHKLHNTSPSNHKLNPSMKKRNCSFTESDYVTSSDDEENVKFY